MSAGSPESERTSTWSAEGGELAGAGGLGAAGEFDAGGLAVAGGLAAASEQTPAAATPTLTLLDTTLRDGEQRTGVALTLEDKLRIIRRLDEFGIDYIEVGFPASNDRDRELFRRLAAEPLGLSTIVAFGSTRHKSLAPEEDLGLITLAECFAPVVSVVGKAAAEHVIKVLDTTLDENLSMIADSVSFLVEQGKRVFFDAEHYFDAYRANPEYAVQVLISAAMAGAELLVLCDTNGGALPHEVFEIVRATREVLALVYPPAADALGIHTHNDSGVAIANSLEAIRAGCVHLQGTINGYGERVGNTDLLTAVANLQLKAGYRLVAPEQLARLTELSHFVAAILNITPDAHQPYSGANAFAHKAGLHASSVVRHKPSYEHVDPALVGNFSRIVISELSGRAALAAKSAELGVPLPDTSASLSILLEQIKNRELAGFSYEIAEASLALYLLEAQGQGLKCFELESFRVITEKQADGSATSEATVKLKVNGERVVTTGEAVGPVNALDSALRQAIERFYPEVAKLELTDYRVRVLDESTGTGAITRVVIDTSNGSQSWGTIGVSENIIEASWNALVDSLTYGLLKANQADGDKPSVS